MKRVGVKDIALKAGVSTGTVDRVLHNRGEVKAETRKKVMAIVKELGYKPNILARSLASKKEKRIAIITPDLRDRNPYWEKSSLGFAKAKEELENHNILLDEIHYDASNPKSYREALTQVCNKLPEGIILNPVFKEITLEFTPIFDQHQLPYVFIDVNLESVNNLAYFGQDALQSGVVSAKLMAQALGEASTVWVIKLSKNKVFSQHIEKRVKGFNSYFQDSDIKVNTLELSYDDLEDTNNAFEKTLKKENCEYIFVPNSRVYLIAQLLEQNKQRAKTLIGFDLVKQNIDFLRKDKITYLISQQPEKQAYKAIYALFNYLVSREESNKVNHSPIDILIKENIEFYNTIND